MIPLSKKQLPNSDKPFKQIYARLELYYEFEQGFTSMKDIPQIITTQDAIDMFIYFIKVKQVNLDTQEKYLVAFINRQSRVLSIQVITIGVMSMVLVDYRTIIKTALDIGASSLILSHNHPSGVLTPSTMDLKSTKQLRTQLKLFDIRILDHLIFSPNLDAVYSFESMKVIELIDE